MGDPYNPRQQNAYYRRCTSVIRIKKLWGERNAISLIKITKGTEISIISGKARKQVCEITLEEYIGGGNQVRFRDFDEKWIIESGDLNK